jgi:hypothetical protein
VGTNAFPNVVKTTEDLFVNLRFRVDVEPVSHPDGRVLVFHIPPRPIGQPYHLGGNYYMRSGASVVAMTPEQLKKIFDEKGPYKKKSGINIPLVTLLALVVIAFVGSGYWFLTRTARQHEEKPSPGPTTETHPPSDNPPVKSPPKVTAPSPKKPNTPKEQPSSVPLVSPDPYVGVSNKQVSQWAMDEADRIEKMENDCRDGVIKAQQQKAKGLPYNSFDAPGPEAVQSRFRRDFNASVKPELVKLHDSINLRLGPNARTREQEQDYQNIMNFSYPPNHSWELCMMVGTYARDLRQMATSLNNLP